MLIVAHPHVRILGREPDGGVRRAERRAQIEIGERAIRNHAAIVERAVLQLEGRHEEIHAAVRVLAFIEDAVSAAKHRRLTDRTPREAEPRRPLPLVRIGDRVRQAGLGAGLDQVLQISIGDGRRRLRGQIDLLGLARDDDRPRLRAVERAGLTAVRRGPRRVLVAQSDIQRQTGGDFEVVLHVTLPAV